MLEDKPQPITEDLRIAFLEMKLVHGTNEAVGKLLGVSKVTVGKYLSGETDTIRKKTWKEMYPALRPYIERDFGIAQISEHPTAYTDRHDRLASWLRSTAPTKAVDTIYNIAELSGFKETD